MKHDFRYISNNDPKVREAYANLLRLLNELQGQVRGQFTFQFKAVGSYSRNMITYDTKSNVGYDFDINIEINDPINKYSAKDIKTILINGLNNIARRYGYDYPEDSSRVITLKVKDRWNSKIIYGCDIAIVNNYVDENGYDCQEYIHFNKKQNTYAWCEQQDGYYDLIKKLNRINDLGDDKAYIWQKVRNLYLDKKNKNENPYVHSRQIFSMTINQIFQKYDI